MNLGVYTPLTKSYILERITQEQIMEKYLNIPVVFDKLVLSPPVIRTNDTSPTCSFYYNDTGRLRFRDLSGAFWGDCFDVVAKVLKVDSSDKRSFQLILHTIAKDFRIHKYTNIEEVQRYDKITNTFFSRKKQKTKTIFKIIPREWLYYDKDYWGKFNVNLNLLNAGKVYPAQEIYMSKNGLDFIKIYSYSTKDPAYCYFGGKDVNKIDNWKIYLPNRKKGERRFYSNSSFLQGKHLITCGRVGIITKAYKDVLSFRSFGLQAVAPPAESVLISKDDYWFMKTKFDYLISCMDYDRAGKKMAIQLYKTYGIPPLMFTNGYFNTINYGVKDFAEYVENYGKQKTINLLQSIYNTYKNDFIDLDSYYYNSLKFIQ